MKTILVATDYSAPAENAVEFAAQLAKTIGAELTLFNVYKMNIHASNSFSSLAHIEKMKKQNADELSAHAIKIGDKYGVQTSSETGEIDTVESLKQYTKSHPVDLVVMGIESNLTEYKLFGNTTTEAIKLMQFPLLVVPNDIKFEGIKKITYACETSYLNENCRLDVLKEFVKACQADLEVLHVVTDHSENPKNEALEELINTMLNDLQHHFRYVSNSKIGEGIETGLEEFGANLLVMVPHKMGFFESMTKGSQTSKMTVRTRLPLLVIPNTSIC
ncbi:MAG: universal stress protein [Crocinitomicaceae bacterium]